MNHLIFQRLDLDEHRQAIADLLEGSNSTAVVVSTTAAGLANGPQPDNRAGHRLVRLLLDPASDCDAFNPLDVLHYMKALDREYALSLLLEPLTPPEVANLPIDRPSGSGSEPAWRILATELFEALVRYQFNSRKRNHSLVEVTKVFFQDDPVYDLGVLLDNEAKLMEPAIYGIINSFRKRTDATRSTILSLIQGSISSLNTDPVQRAVRRTTFDLGAVVTGRATVYVEAPPQLWRSHAAVVRLWTSALLRLAAAGAGGGRPVLFVVDNAAGLGLFPQLRLAQHLPAGAAEVWSFWESLSQLKAASSADWSAFVGSCRSVRALGPQGPVGAAELAAAFGAPAAELARLPPGRWRALAGEPLAGGPAPPTRAAAVRPAAGHVVTFAPVWAERWPAIAAELRARPDRSVVVIESAGTCHALTAAERTACGPVIRLDPFGILGTPTDQFNPLDLISCATPARPLDLYEFTELLVQSGTESTDPLWQNWNRSLIRAVLQYIFAVPEKAKTLGTLWATLYSDDVIYNLAVVLDTIGKRLPADCYNDIAVFLQLYDTYRSLILDHAQQSLTPFGIGVVNNAVERTTFDLGAVVAGRATVYIEAPPRLWQSHAAVVRLWMSALLRLAAAGAGGGRPVLFVVDNAAGLGLFPQLRLAQHLPAGAAEVWSFWESLGQLQAASPADWSAFVGSCRSVRAMGPQGPPVAAELAGAFGVAAAELATLPPGRGRTLAGDPPAPAPTPPPDRGPYHPTAAGHVVTFAPAWADRWPAVAAELRARPDRSVVVVESAGGCHGLTAAERQARGAVVRLDPFGVLATATNHFNPLRLLRVAPSVALADALYFAELLWPPVPTTLDHFWWKSALSLTHGVLSYLYSVPEKECSFVELRKVLSGDDVVHNLAVVRDTIGKTLPHECYQLIAAFLQRSDKERVTVLTDTFQALRIFGDPLIAAVVDEKSSFDIRAFTSGSPMTIYMELPILRLPSHRLLLQLWVSSLLRLCDYERTGQRPQFIVESPFSSELFPLLHMAQHTNAVDVWTFWESPDQIRTRHPADWSAFLANAQRVEAIGPQNPVVAGDLATLFGQTAQALRSLAEGDIMVLHEYPAERR